MFAAKYDFKRAQTLRETTIESEPPVLRRAQRTQRKHHRRQVRPPVRELQALEASSRFRRQFTDVARGGKALDAFPTVRPRGADAVDPHRTDTTVTGAMAFDRGCAAS